MNTTEPSTEKKKLEKLHNFQELALLRLLH